MSSSQEATPVLAIRQQRKTWDKIERELIQKSFETQKAACRSCAELDFRNNEFKGVDEYFKMQLGGSSPIRDKKTGKVIGKNTDYKCLYGHNVSLQWDQTVGQELPEDTSKPSKK